LILPFHAALDVAREAAREQGGTEKLAPPDVVLALPMKTKLHAVHCAYKI